MEEEEEREEGRGRGEGGRITYQLSVCRRS